jgi:hypothetical protein
MQRHSLLSTLFATTLAFGLAACGGNDDAAVPVAQSQTATPLQTANQPVTVSGCLRAGEAANTFVLTASQAPETSSAPTQTATYHLFDVNNLDLRSQVGRRVEVSGTLRAQQAIATRTPTRPADERATGTSGTPTVATTTELAIKEVDVNAIKPLGESCEG